MRSPEGKKPCGRNKCRWEDNIKMVINEILGLLGLDLSVSGYGHMVGFFCEHGNEPPG